VAILGAEVGFVSTDRGLVDFLVQVFELDELPAIEIGADTTERLQAARPGIQYRLQAGDRLVLKVTVPEAVPRSDGDPEHPLASTGLRYVTLYVTDLDGVVARATALGGSIEQPPTADLGAPLALIRDPDGNLYEVVELPA
jgi:catechol 2,3-dioxygenase-like lactoylglutathione lyase family enzyme